VAVYQGKLIGADGSPVWQAEFEAEDDAAAIEYARRNVMTKPIEIWQGQRHVATVAPEDKFQAELPGFFGRKT